MHVVMHAMTSDVCRPGSSRQDEPERRAPGAEVGGDGHIGQESAAPKRRRDIKDQRGDSLTKPYIPFSAGPRDCLGQRLGMTYVSAHTDQACQEDRIASVAPTTIMQHPKLLGNRSGGVVTTSGSMLALQQVHSLMATICWGIMSRSMGYNVCPGPRQRAVLLGSLSAV